MKKRRQSCKRYIAIWVGIVMLAMTGCGSSSSQTEQAMATSDYANYDTDNGAGLYSESKSGNVTAEEASSVETNAAETNRKLIKTVNMTVETEEYDELIEVLNQKITALGGYSEFFSTQGTGNSRYGSLTARIPRKNLDAFLKTIEGASNITYRQENVEDVTLDYVDMESHKKMLQKEQERLLELLGQAQELEDILTIESRLTEVQYQIESMESQLRTYDNQVDYSTVYLEINEVERYTPQEQEGTWDRISTGFMENLYHVGAKIGDFFIEVIIHIPNIALFLIIIGIFIFIIKSIKRLKKKSAAKKQEKRRQQQLAYMQTNSNMGMQNQNVNNRDAGQSSGTAENDEKSQQ